MLEAADAKQDDEEAKLAMQSHAMLKPASASLAEVHAIQCMLCSAYHTVEWHAPLLRSTHDTEHPLYDYIEMYSNPTHPAFCCRVISMQSLSNLHHQQFLAPMPLFMATRFIVNNRIPTH